MKCLFIGGPVDGKLFDVTEPDMSITIPTVDLGCVIYSPIQLTSTCGEIETVYFFDRERDKILETLIQHYSTKNGVRNNGRF